MKIPYPGTISQSVCKMRRYIDLPCVCAHGVVATLSSLTNFFAHKVAYQAKPHWFNVQLTLDIPYNITRHELISANISNRILLPYFPECSTYTRMILPLRKDRNHRIVIVLKRSLKVIIIKTLKPIFQVSR